MASYTVTGPDGRKATVTAPDDATQDEALQYAMDNWSTLAPPDKPPEKPGIASTIGMNLLAGAAGSVANAGSAISGYLGADQVSDSLKASKNYWDDKAKEYGGDTMTGKVANLVGGIAPALIVPEGWVPQLLGNATLFAIPAFKDTYEQKIKDGNSPQLALSHAALAAGINLFAPSVATKGSKAISSLIGKGEGAVKQLGLAAGEGAAFSAADTIAHKSLDVAAGQKNDQPWLDPEGMAVNALGFPILRTAGMLSGKSKPTEDTANKPPPEPPPADAAPDTPPLRLGNRPDPLIGFPDGTVGRRSEVEAYINNLPPEQQVAARAKMAGLEPQPAPPPVDTSAADAAAAKVKQDAADQKDLADLAQNEARNKQAMQAQLDQERIKQQQMDAMQKQSTQTLDSALDDKAAANVAAKQAATTETPTAMQLAMQRAQAKQADSQPPKAPDVTQPPEAQQTTPQQQTAPATGTPGPLDPAGLHAKIAENIRRYQADQRAKVAAANPAPVDASAGPQRTAEATTNQPTAFSRNEPTGQGQTVADVRSMADRITQHWPEAPEVVVAKNMDDPVVPQALRDNNTAQRKTGASADPNGAWHDGKVYLFADHLASPSDVGRVLSHETLGHVGLQGHFGDSLKAVLDKVIEHRGADVLAKVRDYGLDAKNADHRRQAAEEILAEMAEKTPQAGLVKRAVGAIRAWFRERVPGFDKMGLSDNDIITQYIMPARKFIERGRSSNATGKPAARYNRDSLAKVDDMHTGPAHALMEIAHNRDTHQNKISDAKDLKDIAADKQMKVTNLRDTAQENADFAKGVEVQESPYDDPSDPMGAEGRQNLARIMAARHDSNVKSWQVETKDGGLGTLTQEGDRVWINVAGTGEGNGGSAIYDLAANYAKNNGLKFIGDPDGLSDAAMRRRLENMLNAAVKYKSTDFLKPHSRQLQGDEKIGVPKLKWNNGDTAANIRSMMDVSVASTKRTNPIAVENIHYDPATQSFRDGDNHPLNDRELPDLLRFDERTPGTGAGGNATLRRNAVFRALLRGPQERRAILAGLRGQQDSRGQGPGGALKGTFYSREKVIGASDRDYTPEQEAYFKNTGRMVTEKTIKERIADFRKNWAKKTTQAIADQFAPVKDLTQHGYTLLRLSRGAPGALHTFLNTGKLRIEDGAYNSDTSGGVIQKVFQPLRGEADDFLWWVAANRAERLARQDREHLFTDQDIAAGKSLSSGQLKDDYVLPNGTKTRDRAKAYADTLRKFDGFNKNALDMAEQSGLIDKESRQYWEHEFYVPFYRAEDDAGTFAGANIKQGAVRQQAFKALKGGADKLHSDLMTNTLQNWGHLIDAAAKNRAAQEVLKAAEAQGIATNTNEATVKAMGKAADAKAVWVMNEGTKQHYVLDDEYIATALQSLEYAGMKGPLWKALSAPKHWLTLGVTASPGFKIRNLIRDSLQAMSVGDLSYNPIKNIKQGIEATKHGSQTYASAMAGGGLIHFGTMLEGNAAERTRRMVKMGIDESNILDTPDKLGHMRNQAEKILTAYNELGNRGEEINRAALYEQLRKKGVGHAEASLAARDLLDFSMQGSSEAVRILTQVVPFLNARIQGLYKLGRGAKENPARFTTVLLATTAATLGLLALNHDDEDFKKLDDFQRDNYWWVKMGGMQYAIPKPFEIGSIATLAERGVELFTDKEMTQERFLSRVKSLLANNLNMDPTPQSIKPLMDLYANNNSFTNSPINPMGMEKLAPDYRFNSGTSMVARGISTGINKVTGAADINGPSPLDVDYAIQAYFGWIGSLIVGTPDWILRNATNQPDKPTPDYYKQATQGFANQLPLNNSRYVTDLYKQAQVIEQAYGTYQSLLKAGKADDAMQYFTAQQDKIVKYKQVEAVKQQMTKLNQAIHQIEGGPADSDTKRTQIQQIKAVQNQLAKTLAPA